MAALMYKEKAVGKSISTSGRFSLTSRNSQNCSRIPRKTEIFQIHFSCTSFKTQNTKPQKTDK